MIDRAVRLNPLIPSSNPFPLNIRSQTSLQLTAETGSFARNALELFAATTFLSSVGRR